MFRDAERQDALENDDPTPSMQILARQSADSWRAEFVRRNKADYYRQWTDKMRVALANSPVYGPYRR